MPSKIPYIDHVNMYKSSLSLGKTSAGIACCFGGMFDIIRGPRKSKCFFTFLSQNPVHRDYEKLFKGNVGIVRLRIMENILGKKNAFLRKKLHTHMKINATLILHILEMSTDICTHENKFLMGE